MKFLQPLFFKYNYFRVSIRLKAILVVMALLFRRWLAVEETQPRQKLLDDTVILVCWRPVCRLFYDFWRDTPIDDDLSILSELLINCRSRSSSILLIYFDGSAVDSLDCPNDRQNYVTSRKVSTWRNKGSSLMLYFTRGGKSTISS